MDARWRIELLGRLRAVQGDRVLTRFRTQKTGALLAYLAYHSQRSHLRDALIELFWPDSDLSAGRNNLSRELAWLRQHLEPPPLPPGTVIVADRTTIGLIAAGISTDVAAFTAALRAAECADHPAERAQHLMEAIDAYGGELLPGHYDGWVLQEREWLSDRYFQALGELLAHLEQAGEFARALEYARQGVRVDPLREESHCDLIRLLAAAGQSRAALRQYQELERLLIQELDAEPSAGTRALVQQLMARADEGFTGRSASVSSPPAPDATPRKAHSYLPLLRSPLLGRDREVAAIQQLLRRPEVGLVTLTGTAGTGKTRLALQVAAELREDFSAGVFWVDLAPIRDPALVTSTVAQVLGVRETAGTPLVERLKEHLRDRTCLLLLDNFEQVVEAGPVLCELLAVAPHLKLLVTSRIVLRLRDEHEYPVSPLALPDPERLPSLPDLRRYAAVELFVQRARAARPEFALTEENAGAVAGVCIRLDGLPLAIELAAARIRLFSPQAMLSRLGNRLGLLTAGARDLPARQQTLRNAIDWSYDLLSAAERILLRRLSVFAGGWTLAAAEGICSGAGIEEWEVLELLGQLVDKSLVVAAEQGEEVRYRLLETIRHYASEQLAALGEEEALRCRHRDWYLALAEQAEPELRGPAQGEWLTRLEEEHDNLRAVLAWCTQRREGEAGLRLGGAVWRFWEVRGYWAEGRERLAEALALAARGADTAARAKALNGAGALARARGDYIAARSLGEESLRICLELGDRQGIALSLNNVGLVAKEQGDYEGARMFFEESLAIRRQLGDQHGIAASLYNLGDTVRGQKGYEGARALYEESLAIARQLGNQQGIALALRNLGNVAKDQGDYEGARALYEESLAIARQLGDQRGIASSFNNLGLLAYYQGDYEGARALYEESLAICRQLGDHLVAAYSLEGLAAVAAAQGQPERAARLFGAAEALREEIGAPLSPSDRTDYDRGVATARAALGEEALGAAWAAGRALSLHQAMAYALEDGSDDTPDRTR